MCAPYGESILWILKTECIILWYATVPHECFFLFLWNWKLQLKNILTTTCKYLRYITSSYPHKCRSEFCLQKWKEYVPIESKYSAFDICQHTVLKKRFLRNVFFHCRVFISCMYFTTFCIQCNWSGIYWMQKVWFILVVTSSPCIWMWRPVWNEMVPRE